MKQKLQNVRVVIVQVHDEYTGSFYYSLYFCRCLKILIKKKNRTREKEKEIPHPPVQYQEAPQKPLNPFFLQ